MLCYYVCKGNSTSYLPTSIYQVTHPLWCAVPDREPGATHLSIGHRSVPFIPVGMSVRIRATKDASVVSCGYEVRLPTSKEISLLSSR